MNGVTADYMKNSGIVYKLNYGVSIPRIKEIAQGYKPNSDLADRLWVIGIRETMIMSTLIQPIEGFKIEKAMSRIDGTDKMELVEQLSMNLLAKLPYATTLCTQCINSPRLWTQITGFMLLLRIYQQFSKSELIQLIDKTFELADTNEFHLYKAIGLSLSRCCRKDASVATYILEKIKMKADKDSDALRYIANELKQETEFL
jgi:3-methyladenine DNA glycosylase AlkD